MGTHQNIDSFSDHQILSPEVDALDPVSTAVLVVDMVNDFCADGGTMVLPDAEHIYEPIRSLTDTCRRQGIQIVWIRDQHEDLADEEFRKRTPHCLKGTWGTELIDAFHPRDEDSVRTKHRFSGFFGTDLHHWLQARRIHTLILCGVVTNICVRSTAHDAFFLGYDVIVAKDACAATGEREQLSSLYDIETHFGRVSDVKRLLSLLPMEAS